MGRTIQLIRGTSVENSNFTGPEGSLAYDTDNKCLRVYDGITKGGTLIPNKLMILEFIAPDFSRAEQKTTSFTADKYGWFTASSLNVTISLKVNGIQVAQGNWSAGNWSGNLNCQILISPGDYVTGLAGTCYFIPCKGN